MKIKKNDNVAILTGKDRGKTGIVEAVFPKENKVVVAGVAVYKKSVKPTRQTPKGGIIDVNAKINVSNVAIVCPSCSKISRIGYGFFGNKKDQKIRICKKCHGSLEVEVK